jgi:hypothetical protein
LKDKQETEATQLTHRFSHPDSGVPSSSSLESKFFLFEVELKTNLGLQVRFSLLFSSFENKTTKFFSEHPGPLPPHMKLC